LLPSIQEDRSLDDGSVSSILIKLKRAQNKARGMNTRTGKSLIVFKVTRWDQNVDCFSVLTSEYAGYQPRTMRKL
jgi:hypothetical protein